MGTLGQLHLELLDERGDVLVGDHRTLVFLHSEHALRHSDVHVALHLALASQAPVVLDFLACEMRFLRVEDFASAFEHLHLALSARSLTATCRRQEYTILVECSHQTRTLSHRYCSVAVDSDVHVAARRKVFLSHEQQYDDEQDQYQKHCDAYQYKHNAISSLVLNF